jgi:hypothetical protein
MGRAGQRIGLLAPAYLPQWPAASVSASTALTRHTAGTTLAEHAAARRCHGRRRRVIVGPVTTASAIDGGFSMQAIRVSALGVLFVAALCGGRASAQSDEQLFTVLNPTGNAPPIERRAMAPRPESLDGKTIYLVDVTFNGGDLFLQEMQKWMQANMPEVNPVYRVKRGAYNTDDPELWREIQAEGGLMIMAIGH